MRVVFGWLDGFLVWMVVSGVLCVFCVFFDCLLDLPCGWSVGELLWLVCVGY